MTEQVFTNLNYTKRIFMINGYTRDHYAGDDGVLYPFDSLMMKWLKNQMGYTRIVFIDSRGVYYLDEQSVNMMYPNEPRESPKQAGRLMKRRKGMTTRKKKTPPEKIEKRWRYPDLINLNELQPRIYQWMKNKEKKTAIIFYDDSFIDKFDVKSNIYNIFRGNLNTDFVNLEPGNENIIFFIYSNYDIRQLSHLYARRGWENLFCLSEQDGKISGNAQYCSIGPAEKDELENLVNHLRLRNGTGCDFNCCNKFIGGLMALTRAKCFPLKTIYKELNNITHFDLTTLAELYRRNGMTYDDRPAWDRLNELVGLEQLKKQIGTIIRGAPKFSTSHRSAGSVLTDRYTGVSVDKSVKDNMFHFAFVGNPGTGKTMAAEFVGRLLQEEGILESGHTVKVTRKDLVAEYIGGTAVRTHRELNRAMGGVLFVDEAYELIKDENDNHDFGREAVNTIMESMTHRAGEFVVILAGYKNEMSRLLEANPGMARRIIEIEFPDYSAEELARIFKLLTKNVPVSKEIEDNLLNLTGNVLKNRSHYGGEHFGNAGAIKDKILAPALRNARIRDGNGFTLKIEDFETREQKYFFKKVQTGTGNILEELENLTGLNSVKQKIKYLKYLVQLHRSIEKEEDEIETLSPGHFLFLGRPGTGKTTVAKLMARQLHELGLIPTNRMVKRSAKELIGSYEGSTEKIMKDVLKQSVGGVLFIDEAHQLFSSKGNQGPYGKAVIDALVPFMEDHRDEFSLIMAGYPEQMNDMLTADPGFKGRFKDTFFFEDYSPDEMVDIFLNLVRKKKKYTMDPQIDQKLLSAKMDEIKKSKGSSFSNARTVRDYYEKVELNIARRVAHSDTADRRMIVYSDLEIQTREKEDIDYADELEQMIGLDSVKEKIRKLFASIRIDRERIARGTGKSPIIPGHYLFVGNPGTGKTTVARCFARQLYTLGVLPTDNFIETTATSLIGAYVGETEKNVRDMLDRSLGGLLLIDEAHQFYSPRGSANYGKEAVDVLVPFIENHRQDFTLVLAGYPEKIGKMLDMDPGLKSRFTDRILFPDYSPPQMVEIFKLMVKDNGFVLDESCGEPLLQKMEALRRREGSSFANGRSVRNLFDQVKSNMDFRLIQTGGTQLNLIIKEDIQGVEIE